MQVMAVEMSRRHLHRWWFAPGDCVLVGGEDVRCEDGLAAPGCNEHRNPNGVSGRV